MRRTGIFAIVGALLIALIIGTALPLMAQDDSGGSSDNVIIIRPPVVTAPPSRPGEFQPTEVAPAPQLLIEDSVALVTFPRVNIRTAPSTETGAVIDIIEYGEVYRIVDALNDLSWYLIDINGDVAWVSAEAVAAYNTEDLPPERTLSPDQMATITAQLESFANTIGVTNTLRIRGGPGTNFGQVGILPFGGRAVPIGRNEYGTWVQVNYNGAIGWISIFYVQPPPEFNVFALPIRG